jgi:hypothetical protein
MEPEHSGSSSQRPLGLSSRVAFCFISRSVPACLVQGTAERPGVPEIDVSRPVPQGERDPVVEQVCHPIGFRPNKRWKDACRPFTLTALLHGRWARRAVR